MNGPSTLASIQKRWPWVVVTLLLIFSAVMYCRERYFFNPLTFRTNKVLYLPFQWYKNPMQIQVWGTEEGSTSPVIYTTFDRKQIVFAIDQLERGEVVSTPKYSLGDSSYLHITLRTGARPDSDILQDAMILGQDPIVAQIGTEVPGLAFDEYITVTPALQKWAWAMLRRGKPIQ